MRKPDASVRRRIEVAKAPHRGYSIAMPLPVLGSPRPPTHKPLDMRRLMTLAGELEDAFAAMAATTLTIAAVEELAEELDAPKTYIYAAAAMMTSIPPDASAPLRFEICIGGCQNYGATELLRHLIKRHTQRADDDKPLFGIVAKRCLDHCERGAVVLVHTPNGPAGLAQATIEKLDEAIAALFDD